MSKNTQLGNLVNGIFVDSTGRVGVGNVSPTVALDVTGAGRVSSNVNGGFVGITIKNTSTGTNASQMSMQTNSQDWYLNVRTDNHFSIYNNTAATTPFIITTGGNVGINTDAPSGGGGASDRTFSVNAGAGAAAFMTGMVGGTRHSTLFTSSSIFVLETNTAIPLAFNTNGTERMRITSGGDVGIGTSSAGCKLDVSGFTRASGFTSRSGTITIASGATGTITTMNLNGLFLANVFVNGGTNIYSAAGFFLSNATDSTYVNTTTLYDGSNVTLSNSGSAITIKNDGFVTLTWNYSVFLLGYL